MGQRLPHNITVAILHQAAGPFRFQGRFLLHAPLGTPAGLVGTGASKKPIEEVLVGLVLLVVRQMVRSRAMRRDCRRPLQKQRKLST